MFAKVLLWESMRTFKEKREMGVLLDGDNNENGVTGDDLNPYHNHHHQDNSPESKIVHDDPLPTLPPSSFDNNHSNMNTHHRDNEYKQKTDFTTSFTSPFPDTSIKGEDGFHGNTNNGGADSDDDDDEFGNMGFGDDEEIEESDPSSGIIY